MGRILSSKRIGSFCEHKNYLLKLEQLLEFENQPETFTRGLRFVNKESFDELKYNYSKSIIGKKFPIKPESNYESRFSRDWWTHCTLASFVDNLNVEINFI